MTKNDLFDRATKKIYDEYEMKKAKKDAYDQRQNKENWDKMLKEGQRKDENEYDPSGIFPPLNVPDIETEVKDLPPEDENEKIIEVERDPLEDFDENSVIPEPEEAMEDEQFVNEEDIANAEEGKAPEKKVDENDKDATKTEGSLNETENKTESESKAESENNKRNERIIKEAEAIAQKPLPGFIAPANWDDLSFNERAKIVKNYEDTNKVEDHRTYEDNKKVTNFESYRHYPTALKLTEDAAKVINTLGKGTKDTAEKIVNKGASGMSISDAVDRAVPHYDYRSLFR